MALDKNAELLGCVPLFAGLDPEQLAAIVAKAKKTFFEIGAPVIAGGATGQTGYLILSGRAVTRPPEDSNLAPEVLERGGLVGEIAMLIETVYTLDVVAEERVRALAISREDLFAVMDSDPAIAWHLRDKLVERLIFLAHDLREVDTRFALMQASLDHVLAAVG
jgi:CRP-like cAMP-binding protein